MSVVTEALIAMREGNTASSIRREGYHVAYCRFCGCSKSGDRDTPNAVDPGCTASWCLCHTEDAE